MIINVLRRYGACDFCEENVFINGAGLRPARVSLRHRFFKLTRFIVFPVFFSNSFSEILVSLSFVSWSGFQIIFDGYFSQTRTAVTIR